MVGDLKEKVVLLLIAVTLLCTQALGQTTAIDWDNKGAVLEAQGKYSEAIGAYNKAIDINPRDEIAWNNKCSLCRA